MTRQRLSDTFVRSLRNEILINDLITLILKIPSKYSENHLRFLCPLCGEPNTATNKKTNLARCFRCQRNFNPIDLVMIVSNRSFIEAVRFLTPFLTSHPDKRQNENPVHNQR